MATSIGGRELAPVCSGGSEVTGVRLKVGGRDCKLLQNQGSRQARRADLGVRALRAQCFSMSFSLDVALGAMKSVA